MRTAIFFSSLNISTILERIAEGQGITLAPLIPVWLPMIYFMFIIIFMMMDFVDFMRRKT